MHLRAIIPALKIIVKDTVDSTNTAVLELAQKGADEGLVVIANEQTSGRGSKGRSFFSPDKSGIYMSILLRPTGLRAEESTRITSIAAVAVCEAIEAVCAKKAGIKWVNDIIIHDKKVCGILTQGAFENGNLKYAILGIGINIYPPKNGFPDDIKNSAGSILNKIQEDLKIRLTACILNKFFEYYDFCRDTGYMNLYRKRNIVINRRVQIISAGVNTSAFVTNIDDNCCLESRFEDGSLHKFSSGEISIKF